MKTITEHIREHALRECGYADDHRLAMWQHVFRWAKLAETQPSGWGLFSAERMVTVLQYAALCGQLREVDDLWCEVEHRCLAIARDRLLTFVRRGVDCDERTGQLKPGTADALDDRLERMGSLYRVDRDWDVMNSGKINLKRVR